MAAADSIERAIAIATQAHRGQTDKSGRPYITHPKRVARLDQPTRARLAAKYDHALEVLRGDRS